MKLKDQVCSLELAKKLKELGVPQTGLYFHVQQEGQNPTIVPKLRAKRILSWHKEIVSAYTVAELGEMLPKMFVWSDGRKAQIATGKSITTDYLVCGIFAGGMNERVHQVHANTEADARAKMLIYLLENNLIQV